MTDDPWTPADFTDEPMADDGRRKEVEAQLHAPTIGSLLVLRPSPSIRRAVASKSNRALRI